MINKTYKIRGMHCASCAGIIERTFKKTEGVSSAEVNYGNETARVSFDETKINQESLSKKIEPLGYSLIFSNKQPEKNSLKEEKFIELEKMKKKLISAIPLAIISIFVMAWDILSLYNVVPEMSYTVKEFFHHLLPIMATYTLFVVGKPYLLGLYRFIKYGKANMDTLIGIGTSVAFLYSFIASAFEDA